MPRGALSASLISRIVMSLNFSVAAPTAEIAGSDQRFPVRRIFCVGRNYAEHAREMGGSPEREPPFFFTKPADAIVGAAADIAMPPRTENLHHEIELVVALGGGGRDIAQDAAIEAVFGYAVGNDLTRRDLQAEAKAAGRPWDMAKGFDHSAVLSPIRPAAQIGHPANARIWLSVNGEPRQEGDIADLIWPVADIIAELSTYVELKAGDLIYTGTPAGVGRIVAGDLVEGGIDGIGTIANRFA
jgi:fumarylpyruvate hydrolase